MVRGFDSFCVYCVNLFEVLENFVELFSEESLLLVGELYVGEPSYMFNIFLG